MRFPALVVFATQLVLAHGSPYSLPSILFVDQPGPEDPNCIENTRRPIIDYNICASAFDALDTERQRRPGKIAWGWRAEQTTVWQGPQSGCRILVSSDAWESAPPGLEFSLALVKRLARIILNRCPEHEIGENRGGFIYVVPNVYVGVWASTSLGNGSSAIDSSADIETS